MDEFEQRRADDEAAAENRALRQRCEQLHEALKELLGALDESADAHEERDDVAAMLRYGKAEKVARALAAQTPTTLEN